MRAKRKRQLCRPIRGTTIHPRPHPEERSVGPRLEGWEPVLVLPILRDAAWSLPRGIRGARLLTMRLTLVLMTFRSESILLKGPKQAGADRGASLGKAQPDTKRRRAGPGSS